MNWKEYWKEYKPLTKIEIAKNIETTGINKQTVKGYEQQDLKKYFEEHDYPVKPETLKDFIKRQISLGKYQDQESAIAESIKLGAKWMEERMIEYMDEYVEDVMGGCILRAKEWFNKHKKK